MNINNTAVNELTTEVKEEAITALNNSEINLANARDSIENNNVDEAIKERVKKTISQYNMFKFDSKIALGVSGGKDSLGLLKTLAEIEKDRPLS